MPIVKGSLLVKGRLLLLPVIALFVVACSDRLPTSELPEGEMSGTVELRDEAGTTMSPAAVSVTVISDAGETISATTGSDGSWRLPELAPGSYTVEFRKSGFGLVRLVDVPHDSSEVDSVVPALSSAIVMRLSASVDEECGPAPCLDLTARLANAGLFPEEGSRRVLRGFLGPEGELGRDSFDQTFRILVTDDDPLLTADGETSVIQIRGIRGLNLPAATGGDLAVLLVGATENDIFRNPDHDAPSARFPDLAPVGAESLVIP